MNPKPRPTEYAVTVPVFWENEGFPGHVTVAIGNFADPNFPAPNVSVWEESRHPLGRLTARHTAQACGEAGVIRICLVSRQQAVRVARRTAQSNHFQTDPWTNNATFSASVLIPRPGRWK